MRNTSGICVLMLTPIALAGCLMGAGTHGSIKSYSFACKKETLQRIVMDIIKSNPKIARDTALDYLGSSPLLDSGGCATCAAGDNYYNDIKHYVTIKIASGQEVNDYTFRYYGGQDYWDTANSSGLFICYADDKNRNGGSEGNGGFNWRTKKLKRKLTDVFEAELINKVESHIKRSHSEHD